MSIENESRTLDERGLGAGNEQVRGRIAPDLTQQPAGEQARVVEPAAPAESIAAPGTPDPVLNSVLSEDWGRDVAGPDKAAA